MRTTRGSKKTPIEVSKSQKGKNKRFHDEDDDTHLSPVQVDSGDGSRMFSGRGLVMVCL